MASSPRGTWRYRVIRDERGMHRIAEIHTLDDGSIYWTPDPIPPTGSTLSELQNDLRRMREALDHDPPVLLESELGAQTIPQVEW